jgi:hypothetical protein
LQQQEIEELHFGGSLQAAWGGDLFADLLISDLGVGELKKECIFCHDASSSSSSSACLVLMEFWVLLSCK